MQLWSRMKRFMKSIRNSTRLVNSALSLRMEFLQFPLVPTATSSNPTMVIDRSMGHEQRGKFIAEDYVDAKFNLLCRFCAVTLFEWSECLFWLVCYLCSCIIASGKAFFSLTPGLRLG